MKPKGKKGKGKPAGKMKQIDKEEKIPGRPGAAMPPENLGAGVAPMPQFQPLPPARGSQPY